LHLECFDTIGELDQFDTALQASLGHVCLDFGQQVVVCCTLASNPSILERFL